MKLSKTKNNFQKSIDIKRFLLYDNQVADKSDVVGA